MRTLALILGIALTALVMLALVQSMLIPRNARLFIVRAVNRVVRTLANAPMPLLRTYGRRDRWLAGAAPVTVLMLLVSYAVLLILSMSLVVYGTSDLDLRRSLYQAGSTFTTLGIVEPVDSSAALACFVAAFLGLVVIAIFVGYLMSIYGALSTRETQMARLALSAGEPPWAPELIGRGRLLGLDPRRTPDCEVWIDWICAMRMNVLINPVLVAFRSSSPRRHWVTAMLTVMDAAALRIAITGEPDPEAVQLIAEGGITTSLMVVPVVDRDINWDWQGAALAMATHGPVGDVRFSLTDEEWEQGVQEMRACGVELPQDTAEIRRIFEGLRGLYIDNVFALAQEFTAVPAPWSGPRSPALPVIWPELAGAQRSGR